MKEAFSILALPICPDNTTVFPSCMQRGIIREHSPSIETHLAVVRGLPTKKFLPSASTRRSQLSITAKVVRPTDLLNNVRY